MRSGLQNREWVALLVVLGWMGALCLIAWSAPEHRWPKKQGEFLPIPKKILVISISGAVKNPGRYHFEEGTTLGKVLSAIEIAPDADIEKMPSNSILKQGQKIKIPFKKKKKRKA